MLLPIKPMKFHHRFVACFFLLVAAASVASAKAWRGIVPLHSTRADVERILGKPTRLDYIYDLDEGTVRVMYVRQRCEQGVPSGWGNWNVVKDTVIHVWVETDFSVRKLRVRNLEQYKWYTDDSLATYYRLPAQGLEYTVRNGKVLSITYGPTKKDEGLLCQKHVPEIRY
jgi:hypothetical protein